MSCPLMLLAGLLALGPRPGESLPEGLVVGQRLADGRGIVVVSSVTGEQSWFLLPTSFRPGEALRDAHAAMAAVEEVLASPDERWLAVVSSGNEHPAIEVVDLERLLSGRGWLTMASLDPYPARLRLDGWEGHELRLVSGADLAHCAQGCPDPAAAPVGEVDESVFLLDPETRVLRAADGRASGEAVPALFDED